MDAKLMCAPGGGAKFDQGSRARFREHAVSGEGRFPVRMRFLFDEARRFSSKRQVDGAFLFGELSMRYREIGSMKARAIRVR